MPLSLPVGKRHSWNPRNLKQVANPSSAISSALIAPINSNFLVSVKVAVQYARPAIPSFPIPTM